MATKNNKYWQKRFMILEDARNQRNIFYYQDLEKAYRSTLETIETDIAKWYNRFAKENKISLSEATTILNKGELADFKLTINQYIKRAKDNTIDGRWERQLNNLLARKQITRLQSLETQLTQHVQLLYGGEFEGLRSIVKDQYEIAYYNTLFELGKGFGVGVAFDKLNNRVLDTIIDKPWTADGVTFSKKITRDRDRLVDVLHTELIRGTALGQGVEPIVRNIRAALGLEGKNKIYEVRRLVVTESTFFASTAQKDAFKELGVEQYEYLATLDTRTSNICQTFDGRIFTIGQYEPGVTAPPLHVFCRSTTVPYFADDTASERFARDKDGKGIYIPANIKYQEWFDKFGK